MQAAMRGTFWEPKYAKKSEVCHQKKSKTTCTLACNLDHGGGSGRSHATASDARWGGSPCRGWVCAPQNSQSAPSQCSLFLAPSGQPDAGPSVQPAAPPGGALWGCLPGHLPGHLNLSVHSKARGLWHLNCMFACHASFFLSQVHGADTLMSPPTFICLGGAALVILCRCLFRACL